MKLSYFGREHLDVTTTDSTGGTLDISFDGATTWYPMEVVDATHARVLVAGPGATGNPPGTVVLTPGNYSILVRLTRGVEQVIRTAPETLEVTTESGATAADRTICYPDSTDWSCALTEAEIAALDPTKKARAEALAWQTLNALTGGNIAICPKLVRPCARGCVPQTWYVAPVTGASQYPWPTGSGSFQPNINADGEWVNACGCGSADTCSCTFVQEVILPGMVGDIVRVTLNGADLDPDSYRVDGGNRLVRQDGGTWPVCQDMNLPASDAKSFSVVYWDGMAPDSSLNFAAGMLAIEYYNACNGAACKLPAGVTSIVRQGVSMQIAAGLFTNGYTGIQTVDAVISIYNPFGHKTRPVVMSPDSTRGRVQTWGRY